ncbi:Os01g0552850, partial [Oryza sativa Japonica Group]
GDSDDDTVVLSPGAVNFSSAHDTGNVFPPNLTKVLGTCGEQTIGE